MYKIETHINYNADNSIASIIIYDKTFDLFEMLTQENDKYYRFNGKRKEETTKEYYLYYLQIALENDAHSSYVLTDIIKKGSE